MSLFGDGNSILPSSTMAPIKIISTNTILINKLLPLPLLVFFENCIYSLVISN
ncbi:hypothetical protein N8890_00770 [Candidatus Pelagibacter ubique]|nr:hypothetical protein [Candidatus Pelagibacter ubique]